MKFDSVKDIAKSSEVEIGSIPPGGDDFLSRVNTTIINFKELMKMAQEMRGLAAGGMNTMDNQGNQGEPKLPSSPLNANNIQNFLQLLIKKGYGNQTVGTILTELSPLTIKQIAEFLDAQFRQ